jgi:predicted AAA+ superfamily ATPase
LEWFEDACFFFSVRLFDGSLRKSQTNPKKVYCIDHALIPSVSSGVLINAGHLLKNLIFVALRRRYPDVFYYRTKNGREIDFVTHGRTQARLLVRVCESLTNETTKRREVVALEEAMEELHLQSAVIVTRNEEEKIVLGAKTISVVPAWRFLVEM